MNTNTGDSQCELSKKIEALKNDFYSTTGKPVLFKNTIKKQCATMVSNEIGIDTLLAHSIFVLPNTNKIFFDYTRFKLYANPDNYKQIVGFISEKIRACVYHYGTYEVHANLDTFSVSACHRYKEVIQLFCNYCISANSDYSNELTHMYIYYTPSMFHQISAILRPIIDVSILSKLVIYDKGVSAAAIQGLVSTSQPDKKN
jgi:hypothetical protein